jgi:hypothetical protein
LSCIALARCDFAVFDYAEFWLSNRRTGGCGLSKMTNGHLLPAALAGCRRNCGRELFRPAGGLKNRNVHGALRKEPILSGYRKLRKLLSGFAESARPMTR